MSQLDRKRMVSILEKFGYDMSGTGKMGRATMADRIKRHAVKKGIPKGMAEEDYTLMQSIGLFTPGRDLGPL